MNCRKRVRFECDECGGRYETFSEPLQISGEGLEFHIGVSKATHSANYCRPCLADKLRVLADKMVDEWPESLPVDLPLANSRQLLSR